jgi:hypothetical protein
VDREKTVWSSEAMTRLALIHRMLNRLLPAEEQDFRYREVA